jgi:hypothetical protein
MPRWGVPSSQVALMKATKKRAAKQESKDQTVDFEQLLRTEPGWRYDAAAPAILSTSFSPTRSTRVNGEPPAKLGIGWPVVSEQCHVMLQQPELLRLLALMHKGLASTKI